MDHELSYDTKLFIYFSLNGWKTLRTEVTIAGSLYIYSSISLNYSASTVSKGGKGDGGDAFARRGRRNVGQSHYPMAHDMLRVLENFSNYIP